MQNIERKLESALGKKTDLDSRLKSACSSVLSQKIDFKESTKPNSSVCDMLKGKYVNLAPAALPPKKSPTSSNTADNDGEGLPHPKHMLFKEPLDFVWRHPGSGTGLHNCGNTCFLNATLQILIHTPPLTNYMRSGHHSSICRLSHEKCILCNLQRLTRTSLNAGESLSPKWFTNNLQYIGRHFRSGRQEDAHEFLRLSLEKMQKCALFGYNNLDKYSKETTVINQIFGGYLRSQVICCRCSHKSNTYDPLLDISLDIKSVDNIERAFHQFVAAERLEHENAYKCEKCKQKVTAFKRFTIHKPPNVLTIQLKRFQFGHSGHLYGVGNKIHKPVRYPLTLDIRPFMSQKNGAPVKYTLFGSIQHEGMSCNSGHYVANVRCGSKWYHFNDSSKYIRSTQQCLNENAAYILFYIKESGYNQPNVPSIRAQNVQNAVAGVREPERKYKQQTNGFGHSPTVIKTPSAYNQQKAGQQPKLITHTNEARNQKLNGQQGHRTNTVPSNEIGKTVKSPFVPLSSDRDKVKFNIGEKKIHEKQKSPEKHRTSEKPKVPETSKMPAPKPVSPVKSEVAGPGRLVVKIADGKSITYERSPDGERRIISDDDEVVAKLSRKQRKKLKKKQRIVPYGTDSDSDWSSSSSSPKHSASSASKTSHRENGCDKNTLVFDGALNTTTSVPGNAHLFNTVTMKDKVSHTSPHNQDRPKDLKMFTPKNSHHSASLKRQFSETLSCDTGPTPAKHSGTGEWHTSIESMQSPSIGSNHSHSSVHSCGSTHDWSVLKNKDKQSNGSTERKNDGWTVTPGRKENAHRISSEENGRKYRVDMNGASSPFEDVSDKAYLIKPEKSKDEDSEEAKLYKKSKKHKKHKKRKHHEKEHNYAEVSEDNVSKSHKKKKKKKHKHKDRDEEKEERQHKRHERDDSEEERHRDRKENDADRPGKRNGERETDEGYTQKYREDEREKDRHHKRKHGREANEVSHKKSRHDSESSTEFEWVEKSVPARKPSVSEPATPSHRWDHHVKDGYKRVSSSGTSTPTVSASWDGLKASKVVQELEKVHKYSYGAPVSGWDGKCSQMDAERDNGNHKRKDSDDEYDDEYDRGQIKKVKYKHQNEHRHHGNIFQQKQDQTNRSKINWSTIKIGENNPFNKHQPDRPQHLPPP